MARRRLTHGLFRREEDAARIVLKLQRWVWGVDLVDHNILKKPGRLHETETRCDMKYTLAQYALEFEKVG